ncbi:MarR family winged helix-turn-helix transcriptional regulator [Nocardioides dubius]|uniref:MarR family winged helix-turn-helix transcriptional regulator n=1 Tax=Nocardioides dubius TaxID=317019 RepID=A0ABP4E4W4_9ACTN
MREARHTYDGEVIKPSLTPDEADDALLEDVGIALSGLRRRTVSRRSDLTRNLILNIVAEDSGRITVGGVAAQMGVSQPVASRSVAGCIADGLLRRTASQEDGRRSILELTDAGEAERRRFALQQRDVFRQITAAWQPDERTAFARYLIRYSADARTWSENQQSGDAH